MSKKLSETTTGSMAFLCFGTGETKKGEIPSKAHRRGNNA